MFNDKPGKSKNSSGFDKVSRKKPEGNSVELTLDGCKKVFRQTALITFLRLKNHKKMKTFFTLAKTDSYYKLVEFSASI